MATSIGCLVFSSNTGLGVQTKSMFAHIPNIKRVMLVDLSEFNSTEQHPEWYPEAMVVKGIPTVRDIDTFLEGLDCVIVAETPLNYYLFQRATELGIKTIQLQNREFLDYEVYDYPRPTALVSPSTWDIKTVEKLCGRDNMLHVQLRFPVDRDKLPFRRINRTRTFLHSAGIAAAHDRNGTFSVIEASKYVKSNIKILVHFAGSQGWKHQMTHTSDDYLRFAEKHGNPDKLIINFDHYDDCADIYKLGDVLLLPRRYGGLSLVRDEALSCGLPVIMTDCSPNDDTLPAHWLVKSHVKDTFVPRVPIDIYDVNPKDLARKIDEFAAMTEQQVLDENELANKLAEAISWPTMLPKYMEFIDECMKS